LAQVDLHLHTTSSDGTLSPTELVRLCVSRGLRVIAITDHDSTEGIAEAREAVSKFRDLVLIPGIELSTDVPGGEIHMLGYFIDLDDEDFQKTIAGFRDDRVGRARKTVEVLNRLGLRITWERVLEIADGAAIGRPHIAQALVEKGYVRYKSEAFDKWLGKDGPAYVERLRLSPTESVRLLVKNGALPVMAHPIYAMKGTGPEEVEALKKTLRELKAEGLAGIEVHYGNFSNVQTRLFASIADEIGLLQCGGSDYHASGNPGEPPPGSAGPPMEVYHKMLDLKKQRAAGR